MQRLCETMQRLCETMERLERKKESMKEKRERLVAIQKKFEADQKELQDRFKKDMGEVQEALEVEGSSSESDSEGKDSGEEAKGPKVSEVTVPKTPAYSLPPPIIRQGQGRGNGSSRGARANNWTPYSGGASGASNKFASSHSRSFSGRDHGSPQVRVMEPAMPKMMTFDGKHDWRPFIFQFERLVTKYGSKSFQGSPRRGQGQSPQRTSVGQSPPRSPSSRDKCYKCGRYGHFARECRGNGNISPLNRGNSDTTEITNYKYG